MSEVITADRQGLKLAMQSVAILILAISYLGHILHLYYQKWTSLPFGILAAGKTYIFVSTAGP